MTHPTPLPSEQPPREEAARVDERVPQAGRGGRSRTGLGSFVRPHGFPLAVGSVLLLATNGLEKAIPWVLKDAVDAFTASDLGLVKEFALWVVVLALAMAVTRILSRIFIFNVGRQVEYELRNRLLAQVHRLGASFVGRLSTGDIMSRATNDLGQVRLLLGFGALNLVNASVAYVSGVALMLAISPTLTLYCLLPYPLFVVVARAFARTMYRFSRRNQKVLGELATRTQEYLSGVRVVRAFGSDDFERVRFERTNREVVASSMAVVQLRALMMPVFMGFASVGTLVVLWAGGLMVHEGELTKGEFLAFYAYLAQLVWPTMAFGYILSIVQRGRAAYERVQQIFDAEPDIQEPETPVARGERAACGAALSVCGLSHAYGESKVLDEVSLEVPAGGTLAIMGRTGSGKSTLAALLPRLLPAAEGGVYLDGVDISRLSLRQVRKAVGYAPQEPFLFSTTVARNIGFSLADPDSEAAMQRIREAAREAAVDQEIEAMPHGFDTVVGERGVQLSGGQKQRIALARALLNEPEVLVLDDPLSAVDAKTEAHILEALDRAAEGRTLVLITHRTAAAARCDRIVVLDEGRVVESGSHDQLLEAGGFYASLAERQTLERELSAL